MTYKVNDLVYFDGDGYKGVGKIVALALNNPKFLVHSTQIVDGHDGNGVGLVEKQDNNNNWYFSEEDLKPFTKKIGQKYTVICNDFNSFEIGDIVTLDYIDDDCVSYYKKDNVECFMFDFDHDDYEVEFYEDVEDAPSAKENEMFTKDDLKVGYLVKTRDGDLAHLVNTAQDGMCLSYERDWSTILNYNESLTNRNYAHCDIVEVYGFAIRGFNALKFEVGDRKLLWKREEVKEMTIEDIQKALGHKIKVVE